MARRNLRPASAAAICLLACACASGPSATTEEEWISLFNGADLDDWIVKIRGYPAGENYADTFRVEDGLLTVSYAGYQAFGERYGHIFYKTPYSHYRLRVEYRFIGQQAPGGETWAKRNSGVMVHAQDPCTMPPGQDFPISLEVQFLGGIEEGVERPTANMCSPGTNIEYRGQFTETHCIDSSSATFYGDQWVTVEALVLGSERVVHYVNGSPVIEYAHPTFGGGVVSGFRPDMKPDGEPLGSGYIALQSESHPIQFRRVELLNLKGCMDPAASNYRAYYVEPDTGSCRF